MTVTKFHKGMREYFKIQNPGDYLDELFIPSRRVVINLTKFDDWLHAQVGEYETLGMNMGEALTLDYGKAAADFIKSLI